jgi:hypothetical protein
MRQSSVAFSDGGRQRGEDFLQYGPALIDETI